MFSSLEIKFVAILEEVLNPHAGARLKKASSSAAESRFHLSPPRFHNPMMRTLMPQH